MKRRNVLLGLGGAVALGGIGAVLSRPKDNGAPYNDYFAALNAELKANGPMRPSLVIDLDALDHNIDTVVASVAKEPGRHFRVVEKSLPSPKLLEYIGKRANTKRLMSFHQPFLNHDAVMFPESDILIGKPLPVRSAELFYKTHQGPFDPARQLQWLSDTPAHAAQYLALAKGLGTTLNLNIELDVGLHRGGVADMVALTEILQLIEDNPEQLRFAGFMGYDPFVALVPSFLGSHDALLGKVMAKYQAAVDHTRSQHAKLWRDDLTLNTAGSPTYKLHEAESLSNDISVGTGLLKPNHYDLTTLADHKPAAYIATPVLKATGAVNIPGLDDKSKVFSWWDVNQRETYFIYGGYWMADYESPKGLQVNNTFGRSSNQEIVNASVAAGLKVDDQVFLRPQQVEGVLLQFGDLIAVRGGKIVDTWPVFS
ncbi:MAG: DSD1 family PLP-dependent enzyme [Stagnimonas sp.]|nr:DSD1 family PLP-dependent enzyme [Stagnimonas sp.]